MTRALDVIVGANIRARRRALGLSQADLSRRLGFSYQQMQKYERGQSRISGSALYRVAVLLDTPIAVFFENGQGRTGLPIFQSEPMSFAAGTEVLELLELWPALRDDVRGALVDLAKASF